MTEWTRTRLGEICELKRGYDLPKRERRDGPYPIVSSSGTTGYHAESKVEAPGVVTGRYGTLGQVFFVTEDFWPLNTALYVRDFKGNNPRFVAALLESMDLGRHDGAAAVPGLNRNQLHELPVLRPGSDTQASIAAVLQAIDGLIENNRRRIEVSEEMAQAIYWEWFVHFRYPGHEDETFVDSPLGPIPEGWGSGKTMELIRGGLLEIGDGYRAKNAEMTGDEADLPFVRVANVRNGAVVLDGCDYLPSTYVDRLKGKASRAGDSVISMKGTVGRAAFVDDHMRTLAYSPQVSYWRSLDFERIRPTFIYAFIRSEAFVRQCAVVKGSTDMADYVNLTDQRNMRMATPPPALMKAFDESAGEMIRLACRLRVAADNAAAIRDLLLPKLVTGEIDVSELDLGALAEAAS